MRTIETPEGPAALLDRTEAGLIEGALRVLDDPRTGEWIRYASIDTVRQLTLEFQELSRRLAKA